MKTSEDKLVYRVLVVQEKLIALGPFDMLGSEPSNDDVTRELKKRA
jgi:hypothetical protein